MKIVCLGDSITFGYGVARHRCWTALAREETGHTIINAGISGDTTAGMLSRFDRDVLREAPDVLMLLGGTNDLMNGCPEGVVKSNVTAMMQQARAANIQTMLGTLPPLYESRMPEAWRTMQEFRAPESDYEAHRYWQRAFTATYELVLVDFYGRLKSLSDAEPGAYFGDGVHPTARGHRVMADAFIEGLRRLR